MKKNILIPTGAVVLGAVAFIAGRASIGDIPPVPERAGYLRINSAAPRPMPAIPAEITKSSRSAAPPQENVQSLLNQLARLSVKEDDAKTIRPVLVLLEQLSRMGPKPLPAIREFLASGADVSYLPAGGKRFRDIKPMMNALVPVCLRFALFDLVARIGGTEAEKVLSENLEITRNGLEIAFLSEMLDQMAPGSYRNASVAAATRLLVSGVPADRNLLFELMRNLGDTSYVATAQRQMIQPDGQVDRSALRYLHQAMGKQSVGLAVRSYQDPRLAEPGSKEPLARVALSYVGVDATALDLFHTALLDPALLPDQKRNLVEDLNEDGLSNRRAPTAEDLQIITKRYELTQAYLRQDYVQNDGVLNEAFREADKDLRKMLERAASPPNQ
ncbi:hypothetical protein JIN84_15250 [Luteolibacter yonseiensis]|uniref:Uncharacterized protein n=1 Tax=Luteolibacter yonseiensis TaxID=1144680 RepID=A0A934R8D8_9BACT|nr:hypothetical protein [Luteolibacter yonseiensis]MBK1816979.1 hypothetical protein [Luteolibacter yonseiensis]